MERSFVTPEAVEIRSDVAGLGSRLIALIVDALIQGPLLAGLALAVLSTTSSVAGGVVFLVAAFLIVWGYNPLFEILWSGQTPGKRAQRIRVVRSDGRPVTVGAALVRNLVRFVDFLPMFYAAGVVTMLVDGQSRRLGDLAAGTLVVREPRPAVPMPVSVTAPPPGASAVDAAALGHRDYATVRAFLDRRAGLDSRARAELAATIARALRARLGPGPESDEAYLESVAHAYRERFRG